MVDESGRSVSYKAGVRNHLRRDTGTLTTLASSVERTTLENHSRWSRSWNLPPIVFFYYLHGRSEIQAARGGRGGGGCPTWPPPFYVPCGGVRDLCYFVRSCCIGSPEPGKCGGKKANTPAGRKTRRGVQSCSVAQITAAHSSVNTAMLPRPSESANRRHRSARSRASTPPTSTAVRQ